MTEGTSEIQWLLTTNPGLEDVVAGELEQALKGTATTAPTVAPSPFPRGAYVGLSEIGDDDSLLPKLKALRSIHRIMKPVTAGPLEGDDPVAQVADAVTSCTISALQTRQPFRVTAAKYAQQTFSSQDAAARIGAALVDRYAAPVSLKHFDVDVRVEFHDGFWVAGIDASQGSLSKRYDWNYRFSAALKPNIAFSMLRIAGYPECGPRILDPFCGSGTILAEAAALPPEATVFGSDTRDTSVDGCRENLDASGLPTRAIIRTGDARHLERLYRPEDFDAIVTNPPFGVKMRRSADFPRLYERFLAGAFRVLRPNAPLVALVMKRGAFEEAVESAGGFSLEEARRIEVGGIHPTVYRLRRQEQRSVI